MEWISVKDRLPIQKEFSGKRILVLVNGLPHIAEVLEEGCVYINKDTFLFHHYKGWISDPRFAIPTHWMPIPEP